MSRTNGLAMTSVSVSLGADVDGLGDVGVVLDFDMVMMGENFAYFNINFTAI